MISRLATGLTSRPDQTLDIPSVSRLLVQRTLHKPRHRANRGADSFAQLFASACRRWIEPTETDRLWLQTRGSFLALIRKILRYKNASNWPSEVWRPREQGVEDSMC